jgi:hypothetical protein
VHPEDDAAAATQTADWCHRLKHEGGAALLAEWEQLNGRRWAPWRREVLRQQLQYFRNHQHRMDYPRYLAHGWQIGSGPVESGCKRLVTQRLKGAGMRWAPPCPTARSTRPLERLLARSRSYSERSVLDHEAELRVGSQAELGNQLFRQIRLPSMIVDLSLPDLDLPAVQPRVSAWHADVGQRVALGERLVEITAGDVTVDLAAPASGVLIERCAAMDQPLASDQALARIRAE